MYMRVGRYGRRRQHDQKAGDQNRPTRDSGDTTAKVARTRRSDGQQRVDDQETFVSRPPGQSQFDIADPHLSRGT